MYPALRKGPLFSKHPHFISYLRACSFFAFISTIIEEQHIFVKIAHFGGFSPPAPPIPLSILLYPSHTFPPIAFPFPSHFSWKGLREYDMLPVLQRLDVAYGFLYIRP